MRIKTLGSSNDGQLSLIFDPEFVRVDSHLAEGLAQSLDVELNHLGEGHSGILGVSLALTGLELEKGSVRS